MSVQLNLWIEGLSMQNDSATSGTLDGELANIMNRLEAADGDAELLRLLQEIEKEEFSLIGELIQTYCRADTLCRGLIAMLREKRLGSASDKAYLMNDADVLTHTIKEAQKTSLNIHAAGIISAVETLKMHRVFRHTFSHWVVKRYIGGQYLVAFTKSKLDAEKRDGVALVDGKAKLMIFPISNLVDELANIKGHCRFLSELNHYLENAKTA